MGLVTKKIIFVNHVFPQPLSITKPTGKKKIEPKMQIMEMQFEIKTPNIKNFSSKTSPSGPTWDLCLERSNMWDMEDPNNFFFDRSDRRP